MATAAIALGPWGRAREGGSGSLGNVNPLETMSTMLDVRNKMQDWNMLQEGSNIIAGSSSLEEAIAKMRQSPNAARLLPQMQQLLEQNRIEADIRKIGADTTKIHFDTTANAVNFMGRFGSDDPALWKQQADGIARNLDPESRDQFNTWAKTQLYDPSPAGFARSRIASRFGADLPASSVYGAMGLPAPGTVTGPFGPQGEQTAKIFPDYSRLFGGTGSGQPIGITPEATKTQETRGTSLAGYKTKLEDSVDSGAALVQSIEESRKMMEAFRPGPGENVRVKIAQFAQFANWPQEVVNAIARGDLSAAEVYAKQSLVQTFARADAMLPEGSRFNLKEWTATINALPNLNTMPPAIDEMFNSWIRNHVKDRIELDALNRYQDKGGKMEGWRNKFQQLQGKMRLLEPRYMGVGPDGSPGEIDPMAILHLLNNPEDAEAFGKAYGTEALKRFQTRD